MRAEQVWMVTSGQQAGPSPSEAGMGPARVVVLAVVWCRSVGTSWTLELRQLAQGAAPETVVDWINSGVPIWQPVPEAMARELLAARGLHLLADCPPAPTGPRHLSRRRIGYVHRDAELIPRARPTPHEVTTPPHRAPLDGGACRHHAKHSAGGVGDDD